MTTGFNPFGNFLWPFSENTNNQRITTPWFSPALTFNFAGDTAIEERVVRDVASYGKQIGWLNEIVLALANKKEPDPKTVAQLTKVIKDIEEIKVKQKQSRLDAAVDALDQLEEAQPAEYAAFMKLRAVKESDRVSSGKATK